MTLKLFAEKNTIPGNERKLCRKRKTNEHTKEAKRHERKMNGERKIAKFVKKKDYEEASGEEKMREKLLRDRNLIEWLQT
jgi:hypothetical protein